MYAGPVYRHGEIFDVLDLVLRMRGGIQHDGKREAPLVQISNLHPHDGLFRMVLHELAKMFDCFPREV
jgi:hypothetical protein